MGIWFNKRGEEYYGETEKSWWKSYIDRLFNEHKEKKPIDHPDGSVTEEKIANDSVTDSKIGFREVKYPIKGTTLRAGLTAHLSNLISEVDTANNNHKLHKEADVLDHPDGSVTTKKLRDNSVTTEKLRDNSVTDEKIGDRSIEYSAVVSEVFPATITDHLQSLADDMGIVSNNVKNNKAEFDTYKLETQTALDGKLNVIQYSDKDLNEITTDGVYRLIYSNMDFDKSLYNLPDGYEITDVHLDFGFHDMYLIVTSTNLTDSAPEDATNVYYGIQFLYTKDGLFIRTIEKHAQTNGSYYFNSWYNTEADIENHASNTSNPHSVTKAQVGLGNVDNTSDLNKPISTAMQTTLNGKQAKITGGASTITSSNLTANRALISNSSGKVAVSDITNTELGYLDGVTSNIQTQLNTIDKARVKTYTNTDVNGITDSGIYNLIYDNNDMEGYNIPYLIAGMPSTVDVYGETITLKLIVNTVRYKSDKVDYDGLSFFPYEEYCCQMISTAKGLFYRTGYKKVGFPEEGGISFNFDEWKDFSTESVDVANEYTDAKIADLINGAPTTLDTLKEIADAITENESVVKALDSAIGNKVDKVSGKGLSTNDYTTTEKNKLAGIESGAQVNTVTGVKGNSEGSYRTGNINITKSNIGLGNVDNKSSATIRSEITKDNVTAALGYTPTEANIKKNPNATDGDIVDTHLTVGTRGTGDIGANSFTSGINNVASGIKSAILGGQDNTASGASTGMIGGFLNTAEGEASIVLGGYGNSTGSTSASNAVIVGSDNTTDGLRSAIIAGYNNEISCDGGNSAVLGGMNNQATQQNSVVVGGNGNTASGNANSFVGGGYGNTASGDNSVVVGGYGNTALAYQLKTGHHSKSGVAGTASGTTGDAFIIGNGTSGSTSNAFRVAYDGNCYAATAMNSTGADYAECFEWADGNPDNEDRIGFMTAFEGDKIRFANENDPVEIIGVVSALPAVVGDNYADEWCGKYLKDKYGRLLTEHKVYEAETDENGNIIRKAYEADEYVLNPDYNADEEYIPRLKRKEYSAVGTHGKLAVRDDGTCEVGGFCRSGNGGIATKSDSGFYVMERIDDETVRIYIK